MIDINVPYGRYGTLKGKVKNKMKRYRHHLIRLTVHKIVHSVVVEVLIPSEKRKCDCFKIILK